MALISTENPLGQIPNPAAVGEWIVNHGNASTTEDWEWSKVLEPGLYYVATSSGGGVGRHEGTFWGNNRFSGGSGAAWQGWIRLLGTTHMRVHVGFSANNTGRTIVWLDDSDIHDLDLTFGIGGNNNNTANAGGVLTVGSRWQDLVANAGIDPEIATNGNNGQFKGASWADTSIRRNPSPSTMTTDMPDGTTWGEGGGSGGGNPPPCGGGFAIKRVINPGDK